MSEYEVRLESPDGSKRTVYIEAENAEDAEALAIEDEPAGVIPHAYEDFMEYDPWEAMRSIGYDNPSLR